ncbi:tyrosine-type recombinase/integrase [Lacipirellula limnantheis]|uniref:Site-specific tyrosine recombinase XerC n=1 Tax=Lacipirellula limnantheis TaxID=2528024 RepID=A0A517U5C5_9BACT|nr:hypothetical protein [Lacipirellula limnantheis]QDT75760.1 hypothetical protein I41_50020 [Lacipirellula limnantheis]
MNNIFEFAEQYIAARDLSDLYAMRLTLAADRLATFARSDLLEDCFTEISVNRFLSSHPPETSPRTVRSYRSDVLALWNAAADLDLVPYPVARRIKRPKCPALVIDCFSVEEVRLIVAQAERCHPYTMSNGINRRQYWPAAIRLAWDTGLRRGDVWKFRKSWIRPDGSARIVQNKTGQALTVRLHPSTIEALNAIPFDLATKWPSSDANGSRFSKQFKDICRSAGVFRGTFKWLRRGSGSYVEAVQPGAGGKHLGHSSPQVFGQHYDARLTSAAAPMPPALDDGASDRPASEFNPDEFAFL